MEDDELRQRLQVRLDQWTARMSAGDWRITLELTPRLAPGLWVSLTPDDGAQSATLKIARDTLEEAVDWAFVHSISRLLIRPFERWVSEISTALPPNERDTAHDRLGFLVERLAQRFTYALLPKEDAPFLVEAWFAMALFEP